MLFSQFGVPPEYSLYQTVIMNQLKLVWVITIGRVEYGLYRHSIARHYQRHLVCGRGNYGREVA